MDIRFVHTVNAVVRFNTTRNANSLLKLSYEKKRTRRRILWVGYILSRVVSRDKKCY